MSSKHHTGRPGAPRIAIVGAGPGGLTAAMLLGARGFDVTIFEKGPRVGGRNAAIVRNGYTFDTGPTFLMMKFILDEVFEEAGRVSHDYLDFVQLEPMYRLAFDDVTIEPTTDREAMSAELERCFPGSSGAYVKFMERESLRFARMYPCLQKDYSTIRRYLSPELLRAVPHLALGKSLIGVLADYFDDERLQLSFTFQAKYLGMSAWQCPGAFAILPYVEHAFGVYHVMGGLSEISEAMAKVCAELGVTIRLESAVRELMLDGRRVLGVRLEDGSEFHADETIVNADFGHAMKHLVPPGVLDKHRPENIDSRKYSCSTFMLYLGLDKIYDLPHHTIRFAGDYRGNVDDIFDHKVLSRDVSLYIRNASVTDPSLAPAGHSAVYVLVPVPNTSAEIDWDIEADSFRKTVIATLEKNGMPDLESHIREEIVFTPRTWEDMGIQFGATFNLAHSLDQMLYLRPRNRFEELANCYLVGGGTHPGSGLPTIYESGRIAANMIARGHNIPFESRNKSV